MKKIMFVCLVALLPSAAVAQRTAFFLGSSFSADTGVAGPILIVTNSREVGGYLIGRYTFAFTENPSLEMGGGVTFKLHGIPFYGGAALRREFTATQAHIDHLDVNLGVFLHPFDGLLVQIGGTISSQPCVDVGFAVGG